MLREFNILATCDRVNEGGACSELWMLLRAVGDERPVVDRMGIWGIIGARTVLDPVVAVAGIEEQLRVRGKRASAIFRVMPIQRAIHTDLNEIVSIAIELSSIIGADESYRVTVEKRKTPFSQMEVIDPIAEKITQRVDLDNPDWLVLIEIVGKFTGISVVKPVSLLNIQKLNYELAAQAKKSASLNKQTS